MTKAKENKIDLTPVVWVRERNLKMREQELIRRERNMRRKETKKRKRKMFLDLVGGFFCTVSLFILLYVLGLLLCCLH